MNTLFDLHTPAPSALFNESARPAYVPPHNGTATSHAAAMDLSSGKADRDRNAITMYLWNKPDGATRAEIEAATGIHGDALRPRLKELMGEMRTYIGEPVIARKMDSESNPVTRIYGSHRAAEVLVHVNAK